MEYVLPHVDNVDMILVMTTEPGVKGQEVVNNALHKVETLQKERPGLLIKTDGWDEPSREQVSWVKKQPPLNNFTLHYFCCFHVCTYAVNVIN